MVEQEKSWKERRREMLQQSPYCDIEPSFMMTLLASVAGAVFESGLTADEKRKLVHERFQTAASNTALSIKTIYTYIRIAMTGKTHGPDIIDVLELLGREEIFQRAFNCWTSKSVLPITG